MIKQLALATCIALCGVNVEAGELSSSQKDNMIKVANSELYSCVYMQKNVKTEIKINGFTLKLECNTVKDKEKKG